MKKIQKIATAITSAAVFVGISAANAANMADYEKAKAAAMAEIKKVEKEGIAPWNPTAKKPILQKADKMAKKGDFAGAIKYANYITSLQPIAVKEWKSQPNPGPYKPSR